MDKEICNSCINKFTDNNLYHIYCMEHKICSKHMLPEANDLWFKIEEARHIKEIIQSLEV